MCEKSRQSLTDFIAWLAFIVFLSPWADEVTMKEMGKKDQLRAGEILIIVVVLFMWAGL